MSINWINLNTIASKSYTCSYCGHSLASDKGWVGQDRLSRHYYICICHTCYQPTYIDSTGKQFPGSITGEIVYNIDDKNVEDLYNEARSCMSINAFTAAVLCCRKLLMHIAVSNGAESNKKFVEYVEYLSEKNFIPQGAKDWVDHIRKKGNEANHEIIIMNEESAKDLLTFSSMLLKIIYEFPATVKKRKLENTSEA